jgi:hypothetical protein
MGITRDQSSRYQLLANVPKDEFENLISDPQAKPSTKRLIETTKPSPHATKLMKPKTFATRQSLLSTTTK